MPSHSQTSKQEASNRKSLEPPPHTHRLAGKHPTVQSTLFPNSLSDQQASSQEPEKLRAAPSHSQTSRQAPNSTSLTPLLFIFRPASKHPGAEKLRAAPSHSQTSRQAPNSTIYLLSHFTFRPASKQAARSWKS